MLDIRLQYAILISDQETPTEKELQMNNEQKINELKTQAKKLQKAQYNLIPNHKNAKTFGQIEIELEKIWKEIDSLS